VSSLERWWVFRLDRVAAALRHVSAEAVEAVGLRLVETAALSVLADRGGLSQSALGERIGLDRTSSSRLVDRLVDRGLIDRSRHPEDARSRVVQITPAGSRALDIAHAQLREAENRFFEPLFAHELEVLGRALRCLEPPGYAVGDVHWLTRRERRDGG
jgi:DNA-binding MarR family transcriptional regulator